MPSESPATPEKTFQVLVLGGSYAGLAATVNLLDLCRGKACRFAARYGGTNNAEPYCGEGKSKVPVRITIVDERDGFCRFFVFFFWPSSSSSSFFFLFG